MGEHFYLKVPSDPNRLSEIEEFAEAAGIANGFDPHRCSTLGLIVTEAVNNSIHHGNLSNPEIPVEITIDSFPDYLQIHVKDSGHGFDPNSLPDPTAPENLMRDHGRGFLILHHYCSAVQTRILPDGFETILFFSRFEA